MFMLNAKLKTPLLFIVIILGNNFSIVYAETSEAVKKHPFYFPNTEVVKADEMRITALGTGLPTPITRAQKSTS